MTGPWLDSSLELVAELSERNITKAGIMCVHATSTKALQSSQIEVRKWPNHGPGIKGF